MENISSHSLFHFTHDLGTLEKILKNGLRYSLIGEKIPGTKLMYIVPSISLCNIPLSLITEHTDWYGDYAIGIKPAFVKQHGGTPLVYAHSSTPFLTKKRGDMKELFYEENPITPFLKQTMGYQHKYRCKKNRQKAYYDEREWRIVDPDSKIRILRYDNDKEYSQNIRDFRMTQKNFNYIKVPLSDIEYIIIKSQSELDVIKKWFPSDIIQDQLSKVLVYNKIKREF